MIADPDRWTRLPPHTNLYAGFGGKLYPVMIGRWTRRLFAISGPVAKSAPIVLLVDGQRFRRQHARLRSKLRRWGYSVLPRRLQKGRNL
jgi:hypothetical protein